MTAKAAGRIGDYALITGASSGIGAAFAARLASEGSNLILVARRRERLDEMAGKFGAEFGVRIEAIIADLTDKADLRKVERRIVEDDSIDVLVNNAGFGVYKPVLDCTADDLEEMIDLNVVASTRLTRAALPGMVARAAGTIINVASATAFVVPTGRVGYGATKAFMVDFVRGLNEELQGKGIRLQALCPGIAMTEFHSRSGTDITKFPADQVMSAEAVVDACLAGLRLGELVCLPVLEDYSDLLAFEEAGAALAGKVGRRSQAAARYRES